MRESFVIHSEYIEDLPDGYKERFLQMVYNYGIHEEVPTLEGLELSLWIKIQRRIDLDRESYNQKLSYNQIYNQYKKALKDGDIPQDTSFKDFKNFKSFKNFENISSNFQRRDTGIDTDIDTVNDIDNDIVFDIDNDIEIDTVSESMPTKSTPSQVAYSKELFNLFKDAGLPCARNNEVSFMQTDFKNAMDYLRKTSEFQHIHSDDVIGAVKNYIQVLKNPDCYVSSKMNLYSLVKSKMFYNLLPSNFNNDNFKKFGNDNKTGKNDNDRYKDYEKVYIKENCAKCGGRRLFLNPNINQWICDDCFSTYPFSSYQGCQK